MKQLIFMATLLLSMNVHAETRIQACIKACDAQFNPSMLALKEEGAELYKKISKSTDEDEQSALTSRYYWIANKFSVLETKKLDCNNSCY